MVEIRILEYFNRIWSCDGVEGIHWLKVAKWRFTLARSNAIGNGL